MEEAENFYDIVTEDSVGIEASYEEPLLRGPEPITVKGSGHITVFGLHNRFNTEFPQALVGKIAPEEFNGTVWKINRKLHRMISINFRCLLLGCLCCCCTLGCSVLPVISLNKHVKQSIEKMLEWENRQLYHKLGLHWKLTKRNLSNSSMLEYVLLIEFIPKIPVDIPD